MGQQSEAGQQSGIIYEHLSRGEARREEARYGLTSASRRRRLRQIMGVLRRTHAFEGDMTPQKLRQLLEALGPTFVKVGQILSMRPDILPQEYCDELAKLRTDAEPMPYNEVVATVEEEYGRPLASVFAEFDVRPLGSASVAQVHRARLLTGEDVAVKVQRPGVQKTMASDIDILRQLCRHLKFLWRGGVMDLNQMVEEFWNAFVQETDFLVEARNLQEFKALNERCVYIDCPAPYMAFCTEHIVVMDYVEGISLEHPKELIAAGYDLDEIGIKLVDNYATQVLDDGFFHADPHPGNIIVSGRKIVYIDLGMTGRLSAHDRSCMSQIITAVGESDPHEVVRGLLRLSVSNPTQVDQPRLTADVDSVVREFGTTSLHDLDLGQMAFTLIGLARKDKVELPAVITMMARGLVTLEGVLDKFVPSVSMIEIIRQHVLAKNGVLGMAKDEMRSLMFESRRALHGTLTCAAELGEAARMLTRGQLKVNMRMVDTTDALRPVSRIVDRLTVAIVIAGLFIGSSIVYLAGIKPVIFGIPVLGFIGYVVALILAIWVVVDIARAQKRAP